MSDGWYWGVTVRVPAAEPLLRRLADHLDAPGLQVQAPATAHVTLLYAPLRDLADCGDLAERVREIAAAQSPFSLTIGGLFEFTTPSRVVAWLAVTEGAEVLQELRAQLCRCDADVLPHAWQPHCTLLYAEEPAAYPALRPPLIEACADVHLHVTVDALWIAGFPAAGDAAHDLEYRVRVPLGAGQ